MNLEFLLTGSSVVRYHTVDTIKEDLVGRHAHGVAMLCWVLAEEAPSASLLMAALVHDLGEQHVGDIPSPTKRALGRSGMEAIDAMEELALREHGLGFILTEQEQFILKMADCLDGMLFCIRERRLGNKNVYDVYHRFKQYAEQEAFRCEDRPASFYRVLGQVQSMWEKCYDAR